MPIRVPVGFSEEVETGKVHTRVVPGRSLELGQPSALAIPSRRTASVVLRGLATVAAAVLLMSCASAKTAARSPSSSTPNSPAGVALAWAKAFTNGDETTANRLQARTRTYCPHDAGRFQFSLPVAPPGQQLAAHVVARRHTWRVTFSASGSSASSAVTVVRDAAEYRVC
jgi:hypothetical protein